MSVDTALGGPAPGVNVHWRGTTSAIESRTPRLMAVLRGSAAPELLRDERLADSLRSRGKVGGLVGVRRA